MRSLRLSILTLFVLGLVMSSIARETTLSVGSEVPDFKLTNQDGKSVSLSDYRGKGVIISFLFTRCPYPDKCPMVGKKLQDLAELSQAIGQQSRLQVLAITLDPKYDKPEVLKAYAQGFDKKHSNWSFLTGSEEEIARVASAFGVLYWTENGVIEHNLRTAFIDGNGRLQLLKSGSDWRPGEFAAQIKSYLK